ncbi:hypothetical protein ACFYXH_41885 [Streptomyces sp. NPDC002730]|uniref:hypothetical protein n=1 Tax=Streptomyces sp. NPDC002730 TaxID=3364662 RepID=UPI0036781334
MSTTLAPARASTPRVQPLSPLERELRLIAQGASTDTVVSELKLTPSNFGYRLRQIADKLGSLTVARAVAVAQCDVLERQPAVTELSKARELILREHRRLVPVARDRQRMRIATVPPSVRPYMSDAQ